MTDSPTQDTAPPLPFEEGTVVRATIRTVGADEVLVELPGGHTSTFNRAHLGENTDTGQEVDVFVDRADWRRGEFRVFKDWADKIAIYNSIEKASQNNEIIEGEVVATVKGGLCVDVGMRAFLPTSHMDLRPELADPESFIGQRLPFNVIKFDGKRGDLVISRRTIQEKERKADRDALMKVLTEGELRTGTVVSFTNYGAFVDLGGIDGLLHTNDMTWGRATNPETIFFLGQKIKVKILGIDRDRDRISLGYKQTMPDPWTHVSETLSVGDRVRGTVVSLADYGAFVEIQEGVEGLLHVSEMSWTKRVSHSKEILALEDDIETAILGIDIPNRRLSLGLKQLQENPWDNLPERYPKGKRITGSVRSITEFGIFVELEEGIDGLVHTSDMSWTERVHNPSDHFKVGDTVEAKILGIDSKNQRVSLGIKQLDTDPWVDFAARYPKGTKVEATVTKVTDFGAFLEVEPGYEGLCHISQLSTERVSRPTDVVQMGQSREVVVLDVDKKKHKIALSIRALTEDVGDDWRAYMKDDDAPTNTLGDKLGAALKRSKDDP